MYQGLLLSLRLMSIAHHPAFVNFPGTDFWPLLRYALGEWEQQQRFVKAMACTILQSKMENRKIYAHSCRARSLARTITRLALMVACCSSTAVVVRHDSAKTPGAALLGPLGSSTAYLLVIRCTDGCQQLHLHEKTNYLSWFTRETACLLMRSFF